MGGGEGPQFENLSWPKGPLWPNVKIGPQSRLQERYGGGQILNFGPDFLNIGGPPPPNFRLLESHWQVLEALKILWVSCLTVRLHIEIRLVVCTWGQIWPKFKPCFLRLF